MTEAWFDADYGATVGLGHVYRCINLAKIFQSKKIEVKFLTCNSQIENFLKSKNFKTAHALPNKNHKTNIVVVDRYNYDIIQYEKYKELGAYIIAIDDLAEKKICCDAYLNHNLFAKSLDLSQVKADTFFLGPDYFLVSKELRNLARRKNGNSPNKKTVLICFGGTDHGQFSLPVVKEISKLRIPNPIVVMTQYPLKLLGSTPKELGFENKINCDIESQIRGASVVICGAGQTSVEAAIAGIPFVATILADNQKRNAFALKALGCKVIDTFDSQIIAFSCKKILQNNTEPCLRLSYSDGLEKVVDVAKQACNT